MSDDYHYRQREYDYYHDRRLSDHYHDRRERDFHRRKRERERDTLAGASEEVVYNPLAAALRVTVLVIALWLILTVLSMAEAIAYDWWSSAFVVAAVIVLLGLGRELLLCLIRSAREKRLALGPLLYGVVAGIIGAGVLHLAGIIAVVAQALVNAPPV